MKLGRALMGVLYVVAGTGHFVATRVYLHLMPDYLPAQRELVLITVVAEIAGGLGVLVRPTRRAASVGIAAMLVAFLPVHIWMVQHPERYPGIPLWALWARLPLQAPLILWALRYARTEADQ